MGRSAGFFLIMALTGIFLAGQPEDPFESCPENSADEYEYYKCYFDAAFAGYDADTEPDIWNLSYRKLKELTQSSGYAWLCLGHIEFYRTDASEASLPRRLLSAEELYKRGAEQLHEDGDIDGEVRAYFNLYETYSKLSRTLEAQNVVDQAILAVSESKGALSEARALLLKTRSLFEIGNDLGGAYYLAKDLESRIPSQGKPRLEQEFLTVIGNICFALARYQEAQSYYRRLVEVTEQRPYGHPLAKFNLALSVFAEGLHLPDPGKREEVRLLFEEALRLAKKARHTEVELKANINLADLLGASETGRAAARRHYQRNLELAGKGESALLYITYWALAWNHMRDGDEEAARNLMEQARAMPMPNESLLAYASRPRLLASWASGDKQQAIQESRQVLDFIEELRDQQVDNPSREFFFSAWTAPFYVFSGSLLGEAEQRHRDDLEEAFRVIEQMRARILLEALTAGRATPIPPERLTQIRTGIAHINRRLRSNISDQQRRQLLSRLRQLELDENEIRSQAFRQEAQEIRSDSKDFATLNEVEGNLAPDEALLSFQVGLREDLYGDFGGGAWLLVSARGSTRVYSLAKDRTWLAKAIPVFLGLVQRRDGLDARSAPSLYNELMQAAIDDLPEGIRHLIIVPDGPLHHLPFGLLRAAPEEPALAEHYQISVVPSATLWQTWTAQDPAPAMVPALALADPDLPQIALESSPTGKRFRDWADEPLRQLPKARREGSRLVERLGGNSQLLVGGQASERFIKNADLNRFALLHFASHAVVDDEFPERSAVILTPGGEDEDGRLQIREIVDLDLDGRVIVLSACSSASGAVLSGEGVIGLARAFFQAGARTVVGSRWPLRDDDAEEFFEAFYAHLSQGSSIASALNTAQKDRIQEGKPAQAWAGLVALGDGNYIPFPGGLPQASPLGNGLFTLIAALATALALGAYLVVRQRKRGFRQG